MPAKAAPAVSAVLVLKFVYLERGKSIKDSGLEVLNALEVHRKAYDSSKWRVPDKRWGNTSRGEYRW